MCIASTCVPDRAASPRTASAQYVVRVARSVKEVEALRPLWTRWQWHPNSDIDQYLAVIRSTPQVLRPHVLIACRDGVPQSLLVARLEMVPLGVTWGYSVPFRPVVRSITVIYQGMLGDNSSASADLLVQSLRKSLSEGEADVAWFNSVRSKLPLCQAAQGASGVMFRDHFPRKNLHWLIHLPDTYEEFLRRLSSNTRHNLRRYPSRLLKAFSADLTIKCYRKRCDLDRILADTEIVAAKTYQRGLGVGFRNNVRTRHLTGLALDRELLRAYMLYIDGVPCAFWNGVLYQGTFFTGTTGMDPAYREFRPGLYLLTRVFQDMCESERAKKLDFGFGDAQYKRDFCDENWEETSYYMFSPSLKGLRLNLLRSPIMALDFGARKIAERAKLLPKVKRAWRNLVREGADDANSRPAAASGAPRAGS